MDYELLRKYAKLNLRPDLHGGIEGVALLIEYMIEDEFTRYEIVQLLAMMSLIFAHVHSPNKAHAEAAISYLNRQVENYVENGFKVPFEVVTDDHTPKVRDNDH